MTRKTRLNVIIAGAILAAFGLLFAWATLVNVTRGTALNADDVPHVSRATLSEPQRMRVGGSVLMFAAGVGLTLYAALGGRRLR